MLKCKDFQVADQTGFFDIFRRKYEPIESVLGHVNAWVSSQKIKVLNVETVSNGDCGMRSARIPQVIRVWYEE